MPGLLGTGLPQDIEGEIAKFSCKVSPSANCMKQLFEIMNWDAEKEEGSQSTVTGEDFLFNMRDFRRDPYDYLVGACHLTRFIMPANPFCSGRSMRNWRAEDQEPEMRPGWEPFDPGWFDLSYDSD